MSGTTTLWSSKTGDINFPITPTSMDSMTIGATTPEAGTFTNLSAQSITISAVTRYLPLTDAKSDAGVALTATATGGAMGVSRTAGTSLELVGEATSSNGKTDKAIFELTLPATYIAGNALAVGVNCNYTGSGTVTAASTTMTVNAYTESVAGVETAISGVTAAQDIGSSAATLSYTIPGTNLVPGGRIVIELVMLVTTSAGAATGQVNSVSVAA